ncbi:MAG: hypothetical protein AAFY78_17790 [Cyanobacteria bacterium J06648_16]
MQTQLMNPYNAGGLVQMINITLEEIDGVWSVITPHQTYRFPSYELALNFYTSLRRELGLSGS